DLLAHLRQAAVAVELLDGDRPFALVADVDEDLARADVDHAAADHLAFLEFGHAGAVPVLHPFLGRVSALPPRFPALPPSFLPLPVRRGPSVVRPSSYRPFLQSFYLPERPATRTDSGRPWSVPAIIPFRSREMAFIISRLAVSYRALRSAPGPASNRSGSPKVTVTLAGRGKRRPLGHARPEPLMYAGTTAAPLDTAKRPAPGLADRISPSSPRVPSGNTSSAPPSSSTRRAVRRALGSVPSRRIGRALSAWINVRKSGISKSSALAR